MTLASVMPGRTRVLVAACLLALAPTAWAGAGAATPGLARAVDAAWQRAAQARHAEGELDRTGYQRRIARSLAADTPSISYSREEGQWYGGRDAADGVETEVGIAWPLWMPGQRGAAIRAARADQAWAEANLSVTRLEVAGQVREAAWEVAASQAGHDLATARVTFLRKLAADVSRRVAAGDLARTDALSAEADLLAAEAELADAQRALQASHSQWKVLTGLDELPDANEIENEAHVDADSLLASAGPAPGVIAAEQAAQRARAGLSVARRSLGAAPELGISAKEEKELPGLRGDRSLIVSLSVPLGVGARRSQQRAAAQTELEASEAELAMARARQQAAVESARLVVGLADQQLENERRRVALMAERNKLVQQAFAAGEVSLAEVLLTSRQSAEADADLARRHADHGLAHARLLQVIGILP